MTKHNESMISIETDQEKIKKARNAYAKVWRDKNKDKIKMYQNNYFIKLADKLGL